MDDSSTRRRGPLRSLVGFVFGSYGAKVLTLVVSGVLVPFGVLWVFTVRDTEQFQTRQTLEKFNSTLNSTRRDISYWYKDRTGELERLLQSNAFQGPLESYLHGDEPEQARDEIYKYFDIIRDKFAFYEAFAVLDRHGSIMLATADIGADTVSVLTTLEASVLDRIVMSDAIVDESGSRVYQWMLVPVELTHRDHVTVCTRVDLDDLGGLLIGDDVASLYLVDRGGRLLTQPPYAPLDGAGRPINMIGQAAAEMATRGPDGDKPVIHRFTRDLLAEDGRGRTRQSYLASSVHLQELDWWLVCEAAEDDVVAPMVTRKNRLLLANGLICIFFALVAVKLSRRLLKPLSQLSEGARRINEGMVGVKIPGSGDDEIAETISAFNDMAKRIALTEVELQSTNKQLASKNEELEGLNARLEKISMTDGLTGLFNHRHFWNILNSELSRISRYKGELGLIVLDIDDFKQVNDQFGHSAGDRLIARIAAVIKESVRETDICARYGGEEFAILLPDTSKDGVMVVSEKIREAIQKVVFKVPDTDIAISVTASIGVSVYRGSRREFFNAADRALYRSKADGKNRVNFAPA
jgi:diguanylate cyclase (GGDEF)-like protein